MRNWAAIMSQSAAISRTALRSTTVRADTDNGRVELEFAVAPTTVEASSDNGSVDVVVPDDGETYRVEIAPSHGPRRVPRRGAA